MSLSTFLGKGGDAWMLLRSLWTDPWNSPYEREVRFGNIRAVVRKRTSDMYVFKETFTRHVYGDAPHGIVLDFGANVGAFSLFSAQTALRVFAFEPENTNFTQLQKNIALNPTLPIQIFKVAVGGDNTRATLYHAAYNKGASSLVHARSEVSEIVEVVTLERALSLCAVSHIDFLKVDIEGCEYALFEAASINTLSRIKTIAIETHYVRGKKAEGLVKKLELAGFTVRSIYTRFSPFGMQIIYAIRK